MLLFTKEERIKYLGFNDRWFIIVGTVLISFITAFLFNNSFKNIPIIEMVLNIVFSYIFTIIDWTINRSILIYLRKRFPDFKDNAKRLLLFFLAISITVVSVDTILGSLLAHTFENVNHITRFDILLQIVIISIMTMAIYEAIYFYVRLKKSIKEEEQAKRVIVQSQLDALRNQAQPHFLFNSLNTLRDIIDQDTKEDAKQFVDKLSDVYRFILESGNVNLTTLAKELRFAKAYIHIQSERFGTNLKLEWRIPEEALHAMIAPMSLQLLLENAIKHNVISRGKPLRISVSVVAEMLIVKNVINSKSTQIPSTKLGLKNIQKRYALISEKKPEILNDGVIFKVSIPLLKRG